MKIAAGIILSFFILAALTPTNRELGFIAGSYYASHNEEYSELPDKAGKVINKFMDEYLEKQKGDNE